MRWKVMGALGRRWWKTWNKGRAMQCSCAAAEAITRLRSCRIVRAQDFPRIYHSVLLVFNLHDVPVRAFCDSTFRAVGRMSWAGNGNAPATRPVSWKPPYVAVPNYSKAAILQLCNGRGEADTNVSRSRWVGDAVRWC